jgi:hypothetical protein
MCTFKATDKRRPVLVLSRKSAIPLLRTVMVAPITSAIRGVPSEVIAANNHEPDFVRMEITDQRHDIGREVRRIDYFFLWHSRTSGCGGGKRRSLIALAAFILS